MFLLRNYKRMEKQMMNIFFCRKSKMLCNKAFTLIDKRLAFIPLSLRIISRIQSDFLELNYVSKDHFLAEDRYSESHLMLSHW